MSNMYRLFIQLGFELGFSRVQYKLSFLYSADKITMTNLHVYSFFYFRVDFVDT